MREYDLTNYILRTTIIACLRLHLLQNSSRFSAVSLGYSHPKCIPYTIYQVLHYRPKLAPRSPTYQVPTFYTSTHENTRHTPAWRHLDLFFDPAQILAGTLTYDIVIESYPSCDPVQAIRASQRPPPARAYFC